MQSQLAYLNSFADRWNVAIDQITETPTSVLGFGTRDDVPVVLKLSKGEGDESNSGAVLRAFGADATVRVYESDTGAVLLERIDPAEQLVTLVRSGKDAEATTILANLISKLANHTPPPGCPTVRDWGRGFDRYLASGDAQLPVELVHEASETYRRLESTQGRTMLLHGDLQHYNVLFDARRGWIAIDPKGVVGELEYELGALLRNPVEQPQHFANPATVECRVRTLTTHLELVYQRALEWAFSEAVLSAIWDVEDGYAVQLNNPGLLFANAVKPMLET
jgi:streptomycin 6-kinase